MDLQDLQTQYDSIFDIQLDQGKKSDFQFWKIQANNFDTEELKNKVLLEMNLYKIVGKEKDKYKIKKYQLFKGKLVQYKDHKTKKNQQLVKVMNIENFRIQKIEREIGIIQKEKKYGIRFMHCKQFIELFCETQEINELFYEKLKKFCILTSFTKDYSVIQLLGKGNFAKVYYAKQRKNGKEFAVKVFEKKKILDNIQDKNGLIKEIKILRALNHQNVIKLYEVYENNNFIFFVKELLKGGELYYKMKKQQIFSELQTAQIMSKLFQALNYLHSKQIMHRDIKPENLILKTKNHDSEISIADFGLADFYDINGNYEYLRCGTPGYVAPEILGDKNYDFKVDIFSAGVIMHTMLFGIPVFKGDSYDQVVIQNYNCQVNIDIQKKSSGIYISDECQDLLENLLRKNPEYRFSAEQALDHEWFKKMNIFNETSIKRNTNLQKNQKIRKSVKKQEDYEIEEIVNVDYCKQKSQIPKVSLITKSPIMVHQFQTPKIFQSFQSPNIIEKLELSDDYNQKQKNFQKNSNFQKISNSESFPEVNGLYEKNSSKEQKKNLNDKKQKSIAFSDEIYQNKQIEQNIININNQLIQSYNESKQNQEDTYYDQEEIDEIDNLFNQNEISPGDDHMKQIQTYDFQQKLRLSQLGNDINNQQQKKNQKNNMKEQINIQNGTNLKNQLNGQFSQNLDTNVNQFEIMQKNKSVNNENLQKVKNNLKSFE